MQGVGGDPVAGLVFLALMAGLYFLPALAAWARRHPSTLAVFVLNLLLGWTFVFWVAAFVWSLASRRPRALRAAISATPPPAGRAYSMFVSGLDGAIGDADSEVRADYARRRVRTGDEVRLTAAPGGADAPEAVAVWHRGGWRELGRWVRLGHVPPEQRFVRQALAAGDRVTARVLANGPYVDEAGRRRWGVEIEVALAGGKGR